LSGSHHKVSTSKYPLNYSQGFDQ